MKNQELIEKLKNDIEKLKTPDNLLLAGFPSWPDLYARDALISAWALLDTKPEIARATLETLIKYQGKKIDWRNEEDPGKIAHKIGLNPEKPKACPKHIPKEFWDPFLEYWSVDSTPLFIILFYMYVNKTNNRQFLTTYWPNLLEAVNWLINFGDLDQDYFLEYQMRNPHGLWHQSWKDSWGDHLDIGDLPTAIVEAQGYAYRALTVASHLAETLNQRDLLRKWQNQAFNLRKSFNQRFWMEKEKYFCLALNGAKKQAKSITSNPGHLLFTGILDSAKADLLVERFFEKDLFTAYGIRTLSSKDNLFNPYSYHSGSVWPHDNWLIYQGLRYLGYKKQAQELKTALIKALETLSYIPELYAVTEKGKIVELKSNITDYGWQANPLQAWSSASLLNLLTEKEP